MRTASAIVLGSLSLALLMPGCAGKRPRSPDPVLRLGFVGDIMLARGVAKRCRNVGDPGYPFRKIGDLIRGYDIAFGNLECTLSTRGDKQWKGFTFRASPELAGHLAAAGFDVLCVANNHAWDYGRQAFSDTLKALRKADLKPVGIADDDGRSRLLVTTIKGTRIGWIAYCDPIVDSLFSRTFGGKVDMAMLDRRKLAGDVRKAGANVDILIVSLHWGAQYKETVAKTRRRLARQALASGATLVIGHHPHVLQGLEAEPGRLIAYSLGNFVFDQKSQNRNESIILEVDITKNGVAAARIRPVRIVKSQPRPAGGKRSRAILARMRAMSLALGTTITIDSTTNEALSARIEVR